MSSEQKIVDKILADANKQAEEILTAAKQDAANVSKQAQEKADKQLANYQQLSEIEAQKAAAKEISGAQMQAKKRILEKKQELLEAVISTAKEKLLHLPEEQYTQIISSMLDNVEKKEKCEIILSKKDSKKLDKLIQEKGFSLSEQTRDISGGFIVKDGEIEYNYSFEAMIAVEREQIEQIAAQILFA